MFYLCFEFVLFFSYSTLHRWKKHRGNKGFAPKSHRTIHVAVYNYSVHAFNNGMKPSKFSVSVLGMSIMALTTMPGMGHVAHLLLSVTSCEELAGLSKGFIPYNTKAKRELSCSLPSDLVPLVIPPSLPCSDVLQTPFSVRLGVIRNPLEKLASSSREVS